MFWSLEFLTLLDALGEKVDDRSLRHNVGLIERMFDNRGWTVGLIKIKTC